MQNNRMLQARHRYLQARRNLEYQLLKESEAAAKNAPPVVIVKPESELKDVGSATAPLDCPKCHKEFKAVKGLKSHIRNKTCEAK